MGPGPWEQLRDGARPGQGRHSSRQRCRRAETWGCPAPSAQSQSLPVPRGGAPEPGAGLGGHLKQPGPPMRAASPCLSFPLSAHGRLPSTGRDGAQEHGPRLPCAKFCSCPAPGQKRDVRTASAPRWDGQTRVSAPSTSHLLPQRQRRRDPRGPLPQEAEVLSPPPRPGDPSGRRAAAPGACPCLGALLVQGTKPAAPSPGLPRTEDGEGAREEARTGGWGQQDLAPCKGHGGVGGRRAGNPRSVRRNRGALVEGGGREAAVGS